MAEDVSHQGDKQPETPVARVLQLLQTAPFVECLGAGGVWQEVDILPLVSINGIPVAKLPKTMETQSSNWLASNNSPREKVPHGLFPLGFVQTLLTLLKDAEDALKARFAPEANNKTTNPFRKEAVGPGPGDIESHKITCKCTKCMASAGCTPTVQTQTKERRIRNKTLLKEAAAAYGFHLPASPNKDQCRWCGCVIPEGDGLCTEDACARIFVLETRLQHLQERAINLRDQAWLERFRTATDDNKQHEQSAFSANRVAICVDALLNAICSEATAANNT